MDTVKAWLYSRVIRRHFCPMNITLPLQSMTTAEKMAVMEAIWADLCRDEKLVDSPAWHEQVLRERDAAVREGGEIPTGWDEAKRRLRGLGT